MTATMSYRPNDSNSLSPSPWLTLVNRAIVDGCSTVTTSCSGLKRTRVVSGSDIPLKKRMKSADISEGLDAKEVETQRKTMVRQLEIRVEKAKNAGRLGKGICTVAFAQGLEKAMYKQAASFQEHTDLTTLDARLTELCGALAKRQETRKLGVADEAIVPPEPATAASTGIFNFSFKLHLGTERYVRVLSLTRQAQALKFSWSKTGCFGRGPSTVAACNGLMPEPVRKFFFGTRLLRLSARPNLIPQLDLTVWDEIIAEAEDNIAQYEVWSLTNPTTCTRRVPSPKEASALEEDSMDEGYRVHIGTFD